MNLSDCKVGTQVLFGRANGEKTRGVIVKVNPAKCKVRQTEARGTMKDHPVGTIWTVPPSLLELAPNGALTGSGSIGHTPTPRQVATLLGLPSPLSFQVGDSVEFTGPRGVVVVGVVKSVNPKTVSVQAPGGDWRVSPRLLRAAPGVQAPAAKRADAEIIAEIDRVYGQLSPENLFADGERSRSNAAKLRTQLNARLQNLFREIGRHVSEEECWRRFDQGNAA